MVRETIDLLSLGQIPELDSPIVRGWDDDSGVWGELSASDPVRVGSDGGFEIMDEFVSALVHTFWEVPDFEGFIVWAREEVLAVWIESDCSDRARVWFNDVSCVVYRICPNYDRFVLRSRSYELSSRMICDLMDSALMAYKFERTGVGFEVPGLDDAVEGWRETLFPGLKWSYMLGENLTEVIVSRWPQNERRSSGSPA